MIWHDLAHEYHAAMTTQPMLGPPCIENVWTLGDKPFNIQRLTLGSHLGTHVDAPMHFIEGGILIIAENLANVTTVAGRRMTVGAFPLRVRGGDGAPARIFAVEE